MDFSNIKIDTSEVLRYLGANGAKDEVLRAKIEEAKCVVINTAAPKITYKENEREIVFAATLGASVDKLINKTQLSDMGLAVIYDAVANAMIESICDKFEKEMTGKVGARFSPGYGDFPLSAQHSILEHLDATRKIGLTLASGGMLNPVKSVTAVIRKESDGGSQRQESDGDLQRQENDGGSQRRGCGNCNMRNTCVFRKERR